MDARGWTEAQIRNVVAKVSAEMYGGNVIIRDIVPQRGTLVRFTLRTVTNDGPGSRTAGGGRRGPYACWHAFRDVLSVLFSLNPTGRIKTGMAVYRGKKDFYATYPLTAEQNIGSQAYPAYMPDLCDCESD